MARLLIKALERAGNEVSVVSELRSFATKSGPEHYTTIAQQADMEISRLTACWEKGGKPDLWLSYHPYYKAPDFIGPSMAKVLAIPYVTVEASYSARRNVDAWSDTQVLVADAVRSASLNICFTRRDRDGLASIAPDARFAMLPPFIDTTAFIAAPDSPRLVVVAMMRPGDKLASYGMLARALERLDDRSWTLSVVGDGPCRAEAIEEFAGLPAKRIEWLGKKEPDEIPGFLAGGGIYVWPGCGEAYGLAYLEAQAAGLPVVAQDTAGVPEVVRDGETGILTAPGDIDAYASAVARLLADSEERQAMSRAARRFVLGERSLDAAASRLDGILPMAPPQ